MPKLSKFEKVSLRNIAMTSLLLVQSLKIFSNSALINFTRNRSETENSFYSLEVIKKKQVSSPS